MLDIQLISYLSPQQRIREADLSLVEVISFKDGNEKILQVTR